MWCNPQGRSLRRERKGPPETSGTGLDQLTTHRFIKTTAAEARELGWGGISFVARATVLSRPTITAGLQELDQLFDSVP